MTVEAMRSKINNLYDGKWTAIYDMPKNQVVAIYFKLLNSGRFNKKQSKIPVKAPVVLESQISIFELPEYQQSIGKTNVQ